MLGIENIFDSKRTPVYRSFKIYFFKLFFDLIFFIGIFWSRHGLLDEKPAFEPQVRHRNKIRKLFPLSRFLAKTLRANKIALKISQKNLSFGIDFKLYVPPLMYKINAHNISGVRN